MKKLSLHIIILLFLCSCLCLFPQDPRDNSSNIELFKSYESYRIFYELFDLVEKNKNSSRYVYDSISFIKNKIEKEELLLLVDHKNDSRDILTGAFFIADLTGTSRNKPYILLNRNIIDIYPLQKSIVYSLLIHEIRHAYDYYNNFGLFRVTDNNALERYMFQMDALYAEALLIENFLVPNKYSLTEFEKVLLESHQKNGLYDYSVIFEMTDMQLIYRLYKLPENGDGYEKNFTDIIDSTNKLLTDFDALKDSSDDWEKYKIMVSLLSFTRYIKQISYNIIYNKVKKMEPGEFKLTDYSKDLDQLILKAAEMVVPYADFVSSYRDNNIGKAGNIYEKVREENARYENLIFNNIVYLHFKPIDLLKVIDNFNDNIYLGRAEKMPEEITGKHKVQLAKAETLYGEKKFEEAAKLLENILKKEPDNLFIMNLYARSLYWFDKKNSFIYYRKLIDRLDSQSPGEKDLELKGNEDRLLSIKNEKLQAEITGIRQEMQKINSGRIIIDVWFQEAYWKLGTLYLELEDYPNGVYEITRSQVTMKDFPAAQEQAYSYLCESYCILNKPELARYCADKVFKINPKNTYILQFLKLIEEKKEEKKEEINTEKK